MACKFPTAKILTLKSLTPFAIKGISFNLRRVNTRDMKEKIIKIAAGL